MPRFPAKRLALGAALCSTAVLLPFVGMADPAPPAAPAATTAPASPSPAKPSVDEDDVRRLADRQAYLAAHLAALKTGLQLKPEQSSLWPPVESALQEVVKIRGHKNWDRDQDGSPLEALKRQSERLIARGEAMKKLADATGPLLASLTEDQKSRLPVLIEGLGPRRILSRAFAIDEGRDRSHEDRANTEHWEHHADGISHRDDDHHGDQMFGSHEDREDASDHDGGHDGDRDRGWDHADRDGSDDGFDHEGGWHGGHHHEHHHFEDDGADHG